MFQLRFRASEFLYVREGRQALVDRKPFSHSDLEKRNYFLFRKALRTVPGVVEQLLLCRHSSAVSQYRDSKTPCA